MTRKYPNAGLPEELYQRLVAEYNALRVKYKREFNGRIRTVRNCDVRESRKYTQKFCNVIHAYLTENYRGKKAYQKHVSFDNAGLPEDLFKRFCDEIEIAKFVFNNYDWSAELDEDIDRIARRYRSKKGLGRNKPTVKHYLYRAYMLGV